MLTTDEIIFYSFIAIIIILVIWIIRLEVKIKKIPTIKINQDLNNQIGIIQKRLSEIDQFKNQSLEHFNKIGTKLKKTITGIETVRFNPFKNDGIGGNQSFATAIVDEHGDGVVISSLYSRERVSIFAKPIKNWTCEHEMSGEEKEALQKAKERK